MFQGSSESLMNKGIPLHTNITVIAKHFDFHFPFQASMLNDKIYAINNSKEFYEFKLPLEKDITYF